MTHLANLASDPKSLVARMRVGAPEPAQLRRAVAALNVQDEDAEADQDLDVDALHVRIFSLSANNALDRLTRRDLREGCKAILHGQNPPAADRAVLTGLLEVVERNKRRAAFFAVIDAYLDGFNAADNTILSVAERLGALTSRWPWRPNDRWPERIKNFSLLDPAKAPKVLAEHILYSADSPRDVLREAGLDITGRRFGGLAEAAFRYACHLVIGMKDQQAVRGQRKLIEWGRNDSGDFGYKKSWPEFVEASLTPWEIVEPSEAHKSALLEMLERFGGGDPRANPQRWRTIMNDAPGAYSVLMRWLTRASVLQFLDIVDRLMPGHAEKLMWSYRRAFWTSYLLSDGSAPGIDAAWVAFGDDGARLATQAASDSGDKSFSAFGRHNDKTAQHAALILQMGDLTIVDWSHSAKYQVWRRGEKGTPELFKERYRYLELYSAPVQESHVSPKTYSWQKNLARIIEGRIFYSPKASWRPKGV